MIVNQEMLRGDNSPISSVSSNLVEKTSLNTVQNCRNGRNVYIPYIYSVIHRTADWRKIPLTHTNEIKENNKITRAEERQNWIRFFSCYQDKKCVIELMHETVGRVCVVLLSKNFQEKLIQHMFKMLPLWLWCYGRFFSSHSCGTRRAANWKQNWINIRLARICLIPNFDAFSPIRTECR